MAEWQARHTRACLLLACHTHCCVSTPSFCQVSLHSSITTLSLTHTYTHPFNGSLSRTTQVNQYQKGKTSLDFTEARDSEWHWHQLGRMQVCTSLQTDNHASTPPLSFLQAGRPSCCPTNSIRALKAVLLLSFSGMYTALISECAVCIWNILLT